MLRLLPAPIHGVRPADPICQSCCGNPAYSAKGLKYTLLRHGRGLSHEESARNLGEALCVTKEEAHPRHDGPPQAA